MSKLLKSFTVAAILALAALTSCGSNEPLQPETPVPETQSPVQVKVRYKGQVYTANATETDEGRIVYDNPEMTELLQQLSARPDMETVVMDDEIVDFFDSEDMAESPLLSAVIAKTAPCRNSRPMAATRGGAFDEMQKDGVSYFAVYDTTNFAGTHFAQNFDSHYAVYAFNHLGDIALNNKISSLAIAYSGTDPDVCAVLTVWTGLDFNSDDYYRSGHRMTFMTTRENKQLSRANLLTVPCLGYGSSWNNCISSLSFHLGQCDKGFKDY